MEVRTFPAATLEFGVLTVSLKMFYQMRNKSWFMHMYVSDYYGSSLFINNRYTEDFKFAEKCGRLK